LFIKNIDAAGNSGPAAIYAVPFTVDTSAPVISQFALDAVKKSVGFSVNESGWFNYTITDAQNHATSSTWTFVSVAPAVMSSWVIPLPAGTYPAKSFTLNFQDIAGNASHVSNSVDWTFSVATSADLPVVLMPEMSLVLSSLSLRNGALSANPDGTHHSSLNALTLNMSDLLTQSLNADPANLAVAKAVAVEGVLKLNDLMTFAGDATLDQVDLAHLIGTLGVVDPWADLLAHASSLMTH
jgi:hypothetical protein